jgi:hypothetical protein
MSKNGKQSAPDPEAEFLAEQSKLAKRAIGHVVGEMKQNLLHSADVRAWAVRYPLPTVAAAAAAGVGAGLAVRSAVSGKRDEPDGAADSKPAERAAPESDSNDNSAKAAGTVASGLRWVAAGLASAAAEALFAAARSQIESALSHSRNGENGDLSRDN